MMTIHYREALPEKVSLLVSGMELHLTALRQMVWALSDYQESNFIDPTGGIQLNNSCGSTGVIVGVVCSLVFLIVGVLLGVVSVYLILRVRGRLSGPTSPSPPPLPPPATYEEVGVSGEKSHDIQLTSNES